MRFKNRYYLVELLWDAPHTESSSTSYASSSSSSSPSLSTVDLTLQSYHLHTALREVVIQHFGEWGYARVMQSLQVRYINTLTNLCIIRIARNDSRLFAAVTTFLNTLRSRQILLRTIHLAGTIRNCQKRAIDIQQQRLDQLRRQLEAARKEASTKEVEGELIKLLPHQQAKRSKSTPQQTLNQLATLLSQYNAARSQQSAAATSHSASLAVKESAPIKLDKSQPSVAPTVEAIQEAIQQVQQKGVEEIMAIDS